MTITPLQGATQLTVIQIGDARAENNRQQQTDDKLHSSTNINNISAPGLQDNNSSDFASGNSSVRNAKQNEKNVDFSSLSQMLKDSLQLSNVLFEFSMDSQSQSMILRIVDSNTKEVLQQLPSDLALKISRLIAGSIEHGQVTDARV